MSPILEDPAVQNAVASIIVIGLGVLGEYLRRLVAAKTASIRDERIRRIVEDLVAAAEKQFGEGAGAQKLEYVLAQAAARKLNIPRETVEAAVYHVTN